MLTELAVGIARRLVAILGTTGEDRVGPGYHHHHYTSEFENGCVVLWHLGVAYAAYERKPGRHGLTPEECASERGFPPFFKLLSPSEIRKRLLGDPPASTPSVHETLYAYLALASDYGEEEEWLSLEREPFVPPQEYVREIEALFCD